MKCPRCGFDNPDYLEYCQNCSEPLPNKGDEAAQPSWGFVKAPRWAEPDFSADTVSEDDVPADFVSDSDIRRRQMEAERRAAEQAAAEKAKAAAEIAAAKRAAELEREAARRAEEEIRAAERRAEETRRLAEEEREKARIAAEEKRLAEERAAAEAREAERRAAAEAREAERRAAAEAREAERRAAAEAREAERKAAAEARRLAKEEAEAEEDLYDDDIDHGGRRAGIAPVLGGLFAHKNKPLARVEEPEYEDDPNIYYDDYEEKPVKRYKSKPARKQKNSGGGLNTAIKIAAIVAALMLLAIAALLLKGPIQSCRSASQSPTGTNKAPVITPNTDDPDYYNVTVYAKEGKKLLYETAGGITREVTVTSDDAVTFKVHKSSLMPAEPIDSNVYPATPTVYIVNDDGSKTLIEDMPSVMLDVPAIDISFDIPDNYISDDGRPTVSGHIDLIATELTINGEQVTINPDGSFAQDLLFEDTGDYTVKVEGKLPGYQIFRKDLNITVEMAIPETPLIEFPWEYGDMEYSQRVKSSVDTIEVRGRVPAGSTLEATCDSSNASLSVPAVSDDGSYSFSVKMAYPGDYKIHLVCTTESGQLSERDFHVQRAPEYSRYLDGAWQMNYASFEHNIAQAYQIRGTVTEILQEGDYILANLELADGNNIVIEYHNHYGSAGEIVVGKTYDKLYGRPLGLNDDGIPQVYIWFVEG